MDVNNHSDFYKGLAEADNNVVHQLYRTFLPSVTKWVTQNSGTEEDAFDVFQDTLEVLLGLTLAGQIKKDVPFKAYLFRVVRNKWISRLRKKNKEEKVRFAELERFKAESFDEHFEIENDDEQNVKLMLSSTFAELSPLCQQLVPLVQNRTPAKEIALELNMSNANAVHRRKFACFEAWRKRIQKHEHYSIWKKIRLG